MIVIAASELRNNPAVMPNLFRHPTEQAIMLSGLDAETSSA
jgi:hypothetical protein